MEAAAVVIHVPLQPIAVTVQEATEVHHTVPGATAAVDLMDRALTAMHLTVGDCIRQKIPIV